MEGPPKEEELKRDTSLQEILEASLGGRGLADGFSMSNDPFGLSEWSRREFFSTPAVEVAIKEAEEVKEEEPKPSEEAPLPVEEKSRVDVDVVEPPAAAPPPPSEHPYDVENFPPQEMADRKSTPCTTCVQDVEPEQPFVPPKK